MKLRIALFALTILLGLAAGLYYGWVISPAESPASNLASLRLDYRTDYALMVAETYQAEQDLDAAARRLAPLGSEAPSYLARQMYLTARDAGYAAVDLELLDDLALALQTWSPVPSASQQVTP